MNKVEPGINNLFFDELKNAEVGLVCNHTSYNSNFVHLIDIVRKCGGKIRVVFTPEHGLYGVSYAGEKVPSHHDKDFDIDVYSLYDKNKAPPIDLLRSLDFLIYDLQDVGVGWYTYISTLYYSVSSSSKARIPLIVLDRPNPINGVIIEDPILEEKFRSFVGIAPIPVRYGLTAGELARYYSLVLGLGGDVRVVRLGGWKRSLWYDDTGLDWIPSSLNIPTWKTALVYIGTCLLEGTNLSEGRGTTVPFFILGAPWINARRLSRELNRLRFLGIFFRPVYFRPYYSKYSGEVCGGVYLHVLDREKIRPFITIVYVLKKIKEMYPKDFS